MKTYEIIICAFTAIFAVWHLLKGIIPKLDHSTIKSCILGGLLAVLAVAEYLIFSKGA